MVFAHHVVSAHEDVEAKAVADKPLPDLLHNDLQAASEGEALGAQNSDAGSIRSARR
jgi:hypothetical protein